MLRISLKVSTGCCIHLVSSKFFPKIKTSYVKVYVFLGINWEILILFWKHFTLNCLRVFLSILKVNQYIFFEFDNSFKERWNADIYTKQKMHLTWVSVWMDLHNLYKMTWKPCRSMLNNIIDIFYHIGDLWYKWYLEYKDIVCIETI